MARWNRFWWLPLPLPLILRPLVGCHAAPLAEINDVIVTNWGLKLSSGPIRLRLRLRLGSLRDPALSTDEWASRILQTRNALRAAALPG